MDIEEIQKKSTELFTLNVLTTLFNEYKTSTKYKITDNNEIDTKYFVVQQILNDWFYNNIKNPCTVNEIHDGFRMLVLSSLAKDNYSLWTTLKNAT